MWIIRLIVNKSQIKERNTMSKPKITLQNVIDGIHILTNAVLSNIRVINTEANVSINTEISSQTYFEKRAEWQMEWQMQRFLKLKKAALYLDKSVPNFNKTVRPFITEISDGRCVKFDIIDLDAIADQNKAANGRPGKEIQKWQKEPQVSERKATSGTLKKSSPVNSFEKALVNRNSTKQRGT